LPSLVIFVKEKKLLSFILKTPLDQLQPTNIIVRMPNWIGDLVMATPILADLRKAYPKARITAMARGSLCELLKEDPHIDELLCFHKPSAFSRRSERRDLIEKLRKGKYDLGIVLTQSFSSAWLFWQGKIKRRLGFSTDGRRLLLTDPVRSPKNLEDQHLVTTYKLLLKPLGLSVSDTRPKLVLTKQEIEEARTLFKQYGITDQATVVGINPGAAYGTAKCWLPDRFRTVTERLLQDKNLFVVYFGDQLSMPLVKQICEGLPSHVVDLSGLTTLRQLCCLIHLCDVLLTNDSGPMHIATGVDTSVVALFGSTNAKKTGPYLTGTVIHKQVECSPCYHRVCPIDFRCMKRIEADEVVQAILKTLKS
jgi:heptosyltransferase II